MEKSFLQNEGGYRDGSELQKRKKQGVVTQKSHIELLDTIPISLSLISVVYGLSALAVIKYYLYTTLSISDKDIGLVSGNSMWLF